MNGSSFERLDWTLGGSYYDQLACNQNSTPVNVGAAHIKGAEPEVQARPLGGLQIDASASHLKFNFIQYINTMFGAAPTNITEGQPGAPREGLVTVKRNF